jgi:hypothetical protein
MRAPSIVATISTAPLGNSGVGGSVSQSGGDRTGVAAIANAKSKPPANPLDNMRFM